MTEHLIFGNPQYRPELTLPAVKGVVTQVYPKFRHSHSHEETAAMLADKTDNRPIKRFYPHEEVITDPLVIHNLMGEPE